MATRKNAAHGMSGYTLIELVVTVGIISILAAIAIPAYRDYVTRGQLVPATNGLSASRTQMEQYFQDNRTYLTSGTYTPPCQTSTVYSLFTITCTIPTAGTSYLLTATGSGIAAGFVYTLDNNNNQATTAAPKGWNTSTDCWITKKGQTC